MADIDLIMTADDFGRSSLINRAVASAHQEGLLTSASLMAAGQAFDEAVEIARQMPSLAVGLHVVAVDGPAVLPREQLPQLVDASGHFPDAPVRLGLAYMFCRQARQQLRREIIAQFERFASTGLPLSHVDGHQHMHMHPAVLEMIIPLARRFGARGIRVPCEPLWPAVRHDPRHLLAKIFRSVIFQALSRRARGRLRGLPFLSVCRTYGLLNSGHMTEAFVLDCLRGPGRFPVEFYFHPTHGQRLEELGPNPGDLAVLLSPAVRQVVERRGLRIGSYAAFGQLRKGGTCAG